MLRSQIQHPRPAPRYKEEMNTHTTVEHPPRRRVLARVALLVRQCGRRVLHSFAPPGLQSRRHQPADRPHHEHGHDALRLCERQGGGPQLGGFPEATPAFSLGLALVAGPAGVGWQLGGVTVIRGQAATTLGLNERLTSRSPGGERSFDIGDDRGRWSASTWASPLPRAGRGPDGALLERGRLPTARHAPQRVRCSGGTGPGGPTELLPCLDVLRAGLQERRIPRASGLGVTRLRGAEEPALRPPHWSPSASDPDRPRSTAASGVDQPGPGQRGPRSPARGRGCAMGAGFWQAAGGWRRSRGPYRPPGRACRRWGAMGP